MLHTNRTRAGSFGEDAELYDRVRPSYPPALIKWLMRDQPATVLDVGCGTGKAARLFADRGAEVLGVEPDPRMAAVARRHGLAVDEGTFEAWDPRGRTFDLLISAQAWHWVEPVAGALKAAQVVRDGGRIGLFWNVGQPPEVLRTRVDAVYASLAPSLAEQSVVLGLGQEERAGLAAESLTASGKWADVIVETFPWERSYSTAEWIDQIQTHSDHRGLPPEQLAALLAAVGAEIDRLGGHFVMSYETALVTGIQRG
ncbi:MAG: methyltransferase type 11 [Mycobacterium sp.]|nr:methyltransferase type 11 [Mycobacterium sp.]